MLVFRRASFSLRSMCDILRPGMLFSWLVRFLRSMLRLVFSRPWVRLCGTAPNNKEEKNGQRE
ncbi:hypothetical protein ARMA_0577 [Ardenticatena maritima]|uniref:Uncharacterized protein n=1 Tax=Ardenticatena maritima TaxID=872965 RepID=A0A0M8K5K5_9CHLR|nr:hypothetical protein ARMA_0577 [Ardenticatena maritima]